MNNETKTYRTEGDEKTDNRIAEPKLKKQLFV
jgi:hypothetical protein